MFVARTGVFLVKEFLTRKISGRSVQLEEVQDTTVMEDSTVEEPMIEETPAPQRSERLRRVRNVLLLDNDEPSTYNEAMMGPNSEEWLRAMRSEIESMDDNQVWKLVDPLDGVKIIECKWVYKKKTNMDGNVYVYKA